jgi:hypothetical protein
MINGTAMKTLKSSLFRMVLLMLLPACSNLHNVAEKSLLLNDAFKQCIDIPFQPEAMICINTKLINTGVPVSVGEYYLIAAGERLKVLTSNLNIESSFGEIVFSPKGKYLYITYADEGHPYFVFYDTHKFIQDDKNAQIAQLFEYKLDVIDEFYDNGEVVYSLSDCPDSEEQSDSATVNTGEAENCLIRYNILNKNTESNLKKGSY